MDSLPLIALLASAVAAVAVTWLAFARRWRKALGRDETDEAGV